MPDLTRETLAELRALLKRQADALASVEMKPDSAKAYEALNAANRALVKEAYCHLPALLDAAERGLEAEALLAAVERYLRGEAALESIAQVIWWREGA